MGDNIIFKVKPVFSINKNETVVLNYIKGIIENKLPITISSFKRLGIGQNINYKVYMSDKVKYLLRIISRSGYPSLDALYACDNLLKQTSIDYPKIVYFHKGDSLVPYGFFIQEWIDGIDGSDKFEEDNDEWIKDFAFILKKVHEVKLPYFGYLDGPKFSSIYEYYNNLDTIINHSFGTSLEKDYSIWNLDVLEVTSHQFLNTTFTKIKELAQKIKTPIEASLIHGDMLPQNLIYKPNQDVALIDWDEVKANTWVYEIARTCFYMDSDELIKTFLSEYNNDLSIEEVDVIIRLEHVRQLLRIMFITCFNKTTDEVKEQITNLEELINHTLNNPLIQ